MEKSGGACTVQPEPYEMQKTPDQVKPKPILILVETMGSANLGAVARTAAAFGLEGFRLVAPRCKLSEESKMWACYGSRLFENIQSYETLKEALTDIDVAVALSRREGRYRHRHHNLATLQNSVLPKMQDQTQTAYVFGNEESGLSRAHLGLCHYSAEIPVVAEDGSLNLAHAVSITLYEVLGRPSTKTEKIEPKSVHEEVAPTERLRNLLRKSHHTLERVGYPIHSSTLEEKMVKLDRLVHRSGLENWEVRLLLGMLKQVNARLDELS
jgi:tRNA/rRNA methyltransferase